MQADMAKPSGPSPKDPRVIIGESQNFTPFERIFAETFARPDEDTAERERRP